jgi:hypothetical protein
MPVGRRLVALCFTSCEIMEVRSAGSLSGDGEWLGEVPRA